ncbi:MAG: hypothetical protein R3A80_03580 [Bdellovibrionota bacterium]
MRPLTKNKNTKNNEGLQFLSFPWGGIESVQERILFLLLGLAAAALNVKALEAQETQKEAVVAPTETTQIEMGQGNEQNIEGLRGASLEGVKHKRGDLKLGASVSLGMESNAYAWGSRDHVTTSTASGDVSLGIDDFTFTARLAASRDNKQYEEWEWAEDFQMGLSHKPWRLSRSLKFGTGVNVILPITEYSRKYSLLDQGVGARASLIWDLNRTIRGLKITPSVRGTNYQYATPVAFDQRSNEAWRLNTRLVADYDLTKTISLSALFGRTWAWTVKGAPRDRFETGQSISWQALEVASLTLGHSKGGDVLKGNGNSNVALYDEGEGSTFYLEVALEI